jgi:hypothetical protein
MFTILVMNDRSPLPIFKTMTMKRLLNTLTTTYRTLKLLADPEVAEKLTVIREEKKLEKTPKLGVHDLYHHKYFMVQIVS